MRGRITIGLVVLAACKSASDDRPPMGAQGSPPPGAQRCPPSKPQAETSCNQNDLDCFYPDPTFGCPDPVVSGELKCVAGLWKTLSRDGGGVCAPPGPGCPAPEIANGFTCPSGDSNGRCIYTDCTGDASLVYTCVEGHLKGAGPVPSCDGGTDAADGD